MACAQLDFMKDKSYPCNICYMVFYIEKNLLKHSKVHRAENKNCMYCKKKIERAQNLKHHQQTCDSNDNRRKNQEGGGVSNVQSVDDTGFVFVESAFKDVMVLYRKPLNTSNFDIVHMAIVQDAQSLLRREVVVRKVLKWHLALKAILYKAMDPPVVTDPPAVFNTHAMMGLIGSDYDEDLSEAYEKLIKQLDEFQTNGSGWVLDEFVELDVTVLTYTPFRSNYDDDDYDNDG